MPSWPKTPGEDTADDIAEDPEDTTPDIDGAPNDIFNRLPQDDIAEEV